MDLICTVPRPHRLAARWPGPATSAQEVSAIFGLYPSSLAKSAGFASLAGKASLVSISGAVLFLRAYLVYILLKFEFHGKTCVGKGAMAAETSSRASYLVYYIVWRAKLSKLSWSFVWALRTTTTNCSVSFSDCYLEFHTKKQCNFTGTFLWYYHIAWVTYALIKLEFYCYVDSLIEKLCANWIPLYIQRWFAFLYKWHLVDKAFEFLRTEIGRLMKEHGVENPTHTDNFTVLRKWTSLYRGSLNQGSTIYESMTHFCEC